MFYVMGTGSRSLVTEPDHIRKMVYETTQRFILQLREEHPDIIIISGMAEGWDEMLAVIAVRNNIPFHAYIPHPTYGDYYWGRKSLLNRNRLDRFQELVGQAKNVHVSALELYVNGTHANFIRNQDMVDACDMALVYNPESRGTRDAVMRLKQANKPYETYPFTQQLTLL